MNSVIKINIMQYKTNDKIVYIPFFIVSDLAFNNVLIPSNIQDLDKNKVLNKCLTHIVELFPQIYSIVDIVDSETIETIETIDLHQVLPGIFQSTNLVYH